MSMTPVQAASQAVELPRDRKDGIEANYWRGVAANREYTAVHKAKLPLYLWAFGGFKPDIKSVLEIGTGPYLGVLPFMTMAKTRVGVDPNYRRYFESGLLAEGTEYGLINAHFEDWDPGNQRFDAIFCMDVLDHGDMGFHLLPKMAGLLNDGGRLYLHVNLRPPQLVNELHHSLNIDDFFYYAKVSRFDLAKLSYDVLAQDIDNQFDCPTLVAVLEK